MTMDRVSALMSAAGVFRRLSREVNLAFGHRRLQRHRLYQQATQRAVQVDKPLLVLGDPDAGIVNRVFGRDYGCGAICTDLRGCTGCPIQIQGRAEDILPRFESRSHVVFVSCVLEYVDDYDLVVRELTRVSGGDLFVAHVEPESLAAILYPGARRIILTAPPATDDIVALELPWGRNLGEAL